ncbi:hypothetical protein K439DRAFT_1613572 [Ramaria rubella]|nr:hypothetical protein K439DRAFT_1613572 [Ramaria rubella]
MFVWLKFPSPILNKDAGFLQVFHEAGAFVLTPVGEPAQALYDVVSRVHWAHECRKNGWPKVKMQTDLVCDALVMVVHPPAGASMSASSLLNALDVTFAFATTHAWYFCTSPPRTQDVGGPNILPGMLAAAQRLKEGACRVNRGLCWQNMTLAVRHRPSGKSPAYDEVVWNWNEEGYNYESEVNI